MIYLSIMALALLAVLGAARAEEGEAAAREPYQLVRSLQSLQDDIARGNLDAHNAQRGLLKQLGEQFQQADPNLWKDSRNARAAVTFLLSGGDPQVVHALRSRDLLSLDAAILDGAMAYIEGRPDEARERLGGVRARSLPAALGAEIALVQSALLAKSDVKASIDRLDEVRLLMPGTLVEEAALRREIFLVGQADDFDKFEFLATRYFRRYRHSIYAGNFRQRFALSVARFSFAQQTARFPRLVGVLDHLDGASQRALYLLIARTALVRGKTEMTVLAAERVLALTEDEDSPARGRAELYRAAARLVTSGHAQALEDLQQIDAGRLPEQDAELLAAALKLGRTVRKALPTVSAKVDVDDGVPTAMRPRIDFSASLGAINRAQQLLDESGAQLKERNR
ncbi:chemotaxis protein [Rhodopseudomonas palustris]|uniref:Putative chemotaxis protein n=1 Tax=Rhodopseudomonas palustris (strain BisB18) TaxID=316056 RepID=Q21AB4_RHOPB